MLRTDYDLHEQRYRQLKGTQHPGWDRSAVLSANLTLWEKRLDASYLAAPSRALELGCGAGDLTLMLAERKVNATGLDISPTAIEWARQKAAEKRLPAQFELGDVRDLSSLSDEMFDLVLDSHCLHCIIGEDRAKFLEESRRVLKPGGFLLILTMHGAPQKRDWAKLNYDHNTRCQVINGVALRYFVTQEELVGELKHAGFLVRDQGLLSPENANAHARIWVDAQRPEQ